MGRFQHGQPLYRWHQFRSPSVTVAHPVPDRCAVPQRHARTLVSIVPNRGAVVRAGAAGRLERIDDGTGSVPSITAQR